VSATVRPATPEDLPTICAFIRELADYERLADAVRFDAAVLAGHLFGPHPMAQVLMAQADGVAQGFALFFHNFSTFEGRPGIYLEDLYVRPAARGLGLGKALLAHLAALAVERGCARLEWSVLDWNAPSIAFYESLGAQSMDEWTVMRLSGASLAQLAASLSGSTARV
jgi:GNAT superfamily N-acetyltransferase